MDKPKITAKDFFLWAGAMVAFYWSVIAFIFLIFDYINYAFPNVLGSYSPDPYQSGISFEMASVIVAFPLYLFLARLIRHDAARDASRREIWIRRWALILTLFVAGAAIAGDLIALLTTFLNGEELTTAFLLKALVILLVAAGVFMHFIADLNGYWDSFPLRRRYVGIGAGALAVITVVSGFFIVGSPYQARLARFDAQKVSDLQSIQSSVIAYYQAKQALPAKLADINTSLSYGPLPTDPQNGEPYEYEKAGALSFKLCATFNAESHSTIGGVPPLEPRAVPVGGKASIQDNWQHGSGRACFERTLDPSFYPPLK